MKCKSAVTKVEFIVILVCIVFALFNLGGLNSAGRERARRMVCAANMARLAQANHIYANNWDEQFCPPMMEDDDMPSNERRKEWLTNNDFRKYTGLDDKQLEENEEIMPKEYQCPTDIIFKKGQPNSWGYLASYAYNVSDWQGNPDPELSLNCFWNDFYSCCTCQPQPWLVGHKRTAIENPSKKINFTDSSDWWCAWERGADYERAWDVIGQGNWDDYEKIGVFGPVLYRHNEGANFAFYDGHIEYLPKQQAYIEQQGDDPPEQDATGMWYILQW